MSLHHNLSSLTQERRGLATSRTVKRTRGFVRRFLNPWIDAISQQRDPLLLADRIDRYTEGFAVVSTLLCALSAAALASIPQLPPQTTTATSEANNDTEHDGDSGNNTKDTPSGSNQHSILISLAQQRHLLPPRLVDATRTYGLCILHDTYAASCCTSFFLAACALGLSTILNVVGTIAPRQYVQGTLILRHSLALGSIPLFATLSGGFMGLALVVGIDMAPSCSPTLTYIAMSQLGFTVVLVAGTAVRAQIGLVRAITRAAAAKEKISARGRRRIRSRRPTH